MKKFISALLVPALLIAHLAALLPTAYAAEEASGANIALGKTVYGVPYDQSYSLDKATDGNYNTNAAPGGAYDFGKYNSGMVVDLEDVYLVSEVKVYTRSDLDQLWARVGLQVNAATKLDFSDDKYLGGISDAIDFKAACTIKLKEPVKAKYIRCAGISAVAEIEVYGEPYVEGGVKEYLDADTDSLYNAVNLIDELGIMSSASDTAFGVDFLMSRKESAKILCSIFAPGVNFTEYSGVFADVTADNEYAPYIEACLNKGVISPSDNFRPNDYITVPEFAKMLLCVSGYYSYVSPDTRYPVGVMSDASDIKLFAGISDVGTGYLSKGDAAVMLYNLLMGSVYNTSSETEKSYLEYVFGKELLKGVVTNNGITSLTDENSSLKSGFVEIAGKQYDDLSGTAAEFLGHNVYYLVNDDVDVLRIWTNKKKTQTKIIYDYEITDASFDRIETKEGNKTKKYNLKAEPYTFLNGGAYHNFTEEDLIPENGYLELVDNDDDGKYELLKVYKPEIFEVEAVNVSEDSGEVTIAGGNGDIRTISGDSKLVIYNSKGTKFTPNNIYKGNVVYFYRSNGKVMNTVEVLNVATSGAVTQNSENTITVDDEEFDKSEYFKKNYSDIKVGIEGQFILDKNRRVVYLREEKQQLSGQVLGVVVKVYGTEYEDNAVLEVYTENKEFEKLEFVEKPKINGVKKAACDILQDYGREYFVSKLVLMDINNSGKIASLDTENVGASNSSLEKSSIEMSGLRRGASGMYNKYQQMVLLEDNIPMFVIPVNDNGAPLRGDIYDLRYNCTTMTRMYSLRGEGTSDVTLYGVDEVNKPFAAVRREVFAGSTTHHGTIQGLFDVSLMVYDGYSICVDSNNELYYKIKGYDVKSGSPVTIETLPTITHAVNSQKIIRDNVTACIGSENRIKNEKVTPEYTVAIENLKRGDVLRYSKGVYTKISQLELITAKDSWQNADDEDKMYDDYRVSYSMGDSSAYVFSTVKMQTSKVDKIEDGYIYFYYGTEKQAIKLSQFTGSMIVVNSDGIETYKAIKAASYLTDGKHIVMYANAGNDISIIMYNY